MAIKLDKKNSDFFTEVNLTPLIDIMLVLLIIFMMTSSISLESGLDINLPKTTSQTSNKDSNAVLVSLDSQGQVSVQGRRIQESDLEKEIREALARSKTDLVVFEGDKTSQLGRAITIMDIARNAGAIKFAIAAEQVKEE